MRASREATYSPQPEKETQIYTISKIIYDANIQVSLIKEDQAI